MLAEQRLQFAQTGEAEALREAHDGRGLHAAALGNLRDAVDHQRAAVAFDVSRDARELGGKRVVIGSDAREQRWLVAYSLLSFTCRLFVTFATAVLLATRFQWVGVVVALWGAVLMAYV